MRPRVWNRRRGPPPGQKNAFPFGTESFRNCKPKRLAKRVASPAFELFCKQNENDLNHVLVGILLSFLYVRTFFYKYVKAEIDPDLNCLSTQVETKRESIFIQFCILNLFQAGTCVEGHNSLFYVC